MNNSNKKNKNENNLPANNEHGKDESEPAANQPESGKEENTGMDMGTVYKEDREQDLDDLIHSRSSIDKATAIPPPEES